MATRYRIEVHAGSGVWLTDGTETYESMTAAELATIEHPKFWGIKTRVVAVKEEK